MCSLVPDSVTAIAFVPRTHYMFSTGKDKAVKYWDADKFEPLLTLSGHHAAVWCVAGRDFADRHSVAFQLNFLRLFVPETSPDATLRCWGHNRFQKVSSKC